MTTYGTIPTAPPTLSSLHFVSLAKERIRAGLGMQRPWKEMIRLHDLNFPSTLFQFFQRMKINVAFFRMNYTIIILSLLFISLLWHPISLIVFIFAMIAWLFLYFLRDDPCTVFGYAIDDWVMMMVLSSVTIVALILSNATVNIMVALSIGLVVVIIHGALRETDDLFFVDADEGLGSGGGGVVKTPLQHAASDSFSLS